MDRAAIRDLQQAGPLRGVQRAPQHDLALDPIDPLVPYALNSHCAAGAWYGRGLVCYPSSDKEGNRRLPEHALYDLRSRVDRASVERNLGHGLSLRVELSDAPVM